jgi:hypothetical protein
MIEKFKNFDIDEFIKRKKALKESLFKDDYDAEDNLDDENAEKEEDVIIGKAVYEDPYLAKIAKIILNRLDKSNLGTFGIYHDITYLNGIPGVWFYDYDGKVDIVCCRNRNKKVIAVFHNFEINDKNRAIITYSTEKIGFKDMIDQMIDELHDSIPVNEGLILEAGGFGDGYSDKNIKNFMRLSTADKQYMYDLVSSKKKGDAILHMKSGFASKDPTIMRILNTFGAKGANEGSCKYIIGLALDVMNDRYSSVSPDFALLVKDYNSRFAGGSAGPVVTVTTDDEYEAADVDEEEDERIKAILAAREAEIEEDWKNYVETMQSLEDTMNAMCHYVKNNGKLNDDDASIMSRRAILITGTPGNGKSYTINKVLEEQKMVEFRDYILLGNGSTAPRDMYTTFYEYNGKLIIYDDAPKLFTGDYREGFWKWALQTDVNTAKLTFPAGKSTMGLNVYDAADKDLVKDRQRRYYLEMGRKSDDERMEFFKKEMKKMGLEPSVHIGAPIKGIKGFKKVRSKEGAGDAEVQEMMAKINDMWKDESRNFKPAMPSHFYFNGVVVVITNVGRSRFISELGKSGWEAIESRFTNYDINPRVESLWRVIKAKIMDEYNDKSLDDRMRMIPADMTEEFIAEVEKLIEDPNYQRLTWRGIRAFGKILRGAPGLRTWKSSLKRELTTTFAS